MSEKKSVSQSHWPEREGEFEGEVKVQFHFCSISVSGEWLISAAAAAKVAAKKTWPQIIQSKYLLVFLCRFVRTRIFPLPPLPGLPSWGVGILSPDRRWRRPFVLLRGLTVLVAGVGSASRRRRRRRRREERCKVSREKNMSSLHYSN